jgi:hypothetical protein
MAQNFGALYYGSRSSILYATGGTLNLTQGPIPFNPYHDDILYLYNQSGEQGAASFQFLADGIYHFDGFVNLTDVGASSNGPPAAGYQFGLGVAVGATAAAVTAANAPVSHTMQTGTTGALKTTLRYSDYISAGKGQFGAIVGIGYQGSAGLVDAHFAITLLQGSTP